MQFDALLLRRANLSMFTDLADILLWFIHDDKTKQLVIHERLVADDIACNIIEKFCDPEVFRVYLAKASESWSAIYSMNASVAKKIDKECMNLWRQCKLSALHNISNYHKSPEKWELVILQAYGQINIEDAMGIIPLGCYAKSRLRR